MRQVQIVPTFEAWREQARACLRDEVAPEAVVWSGTSHRQGEQQSSLFGAFAVRPAVRTSLHIPGSFLQAAKEVACHRNPNRWDLLYRLVWRLTHGEPQLLEVAVDNDTRLFQRYLAAVRRDIHKCHAFVRFRECDGRYVAWYRPDHFILPLAAPHFVSRFAAMQWSILSADLSIHWDGKRLEHGPGVPRPQGISGDGVEELWRLYYSSIFNPARVKINAMRQEMPRRYWDLMPETQLIDRLVAEAPTRLREYAAALPPSATPLIPKEPASTSDLAKAAESCAVCNWCSRSTRTVFGAGAATAHVVLVGEQPGDEEDLQGLPFVGPAGQLLQKALEAADLPRDAVYVTNAVKHFKWTPRGKKRLHQRPNAQDIAACRPWLSAEMALLKPEVVVCLGVTAAQSVLGKSVKLQAVRGTWHRTAFCQRTLITNHPAAILRAPSEDQNALLEQFIADLQRVKDG